MQIELVDFYSRLGTIVLILILGFVLGKLRLIDSATNHGFVNLLLNVFMPASLFLAFPANFDVATADLFFAGLAGGIIVMFALIIASRLIFNKHFYKGEIRFESQFALIFNNATFLGYPIISSTFGTAGVVPYCGFIIAFNVALFSYGVYLFRRRITRELFTGIITNPNIIAVALGVIFFLAGLHLPAFASDAVLYTSNATTALSVICIGYMLSRADFRTVFKKWRLVCTAAIQLTVGPLLTYFLLSFLNFPAEVITVCTLVQALPTATSLGLFAAKYGGNEIESSELVVVSTFLSIFTLPLMAWFLLIR